MTGRNVSLSGSLFAQFERTIGVSSTALVPTWAASTSYSKFDLVKYGDKHYRSKQAHDSRTTTPPLDGSYWEEVSIRSSRIWFGAPTSSHTKSGTNTGTVLIGMDADGGNMSGGVPLTSDNAVGFDRPFEDPAQIYLSGTEGDAVEVQIYQ